MTEDPETPILLPLTEDDRARMREAGLSDEEIEKLDRVRLSEKLPDD